MKRIIAVVAFGALAVIAGQGTANAEVTTQSGSERDHMTSNSSYEGTTNDAEDHMASDLEGSGVVSQNGSYKARQLSRLVPVQVEVLDPITGEVIGYETKYVWVEPKEPLNSIVVVYNP